MDELKKTIKEVIRILRNKHTLDEFSRFTMCENLYSLLLKYFDINKDKPNQTETELDCCRYTITDLIPITYNRISKADAEYIPKYYELWQRAYALAGRRSLEHFIDYMEWDMPKKVLGNRRDILRPFIYYLNKSAFDEKLEYIVSSYFPSAGKSYTLNNYSAWIFGQSFQNSILRISYSDELVLGFSRAIQSLIRNPRFSEVFPEYKAYGDKPFLKDKESDWLLKGKKISTESNHIARTREGQVTGVRASKAIIFDDLTKGAEESTNSLQHQKVYNSWVSEWINRRTDNLTKYIFAGTMWSPEDILNRITQDIYKFIDIKPSKKFKYVWEAVDGSAVFIRIPLLDENDKSTCPIVMTTEKALKLRATTDPFLWSCVYQQKPIAPTGLEFAWENLQTYETLPKDIGNYSLAVLDPSRKGKDNVSMPIFKPYQDKFFMTACVFKKKAMRELYDEIVYNIIKHNIRKLVIENNTDESLKEVISKKLKEKGFNCEIIEKYNTKNKEQRIKDMRFDILTKIIFLDNSKILPNTDYGRFMTNLTRYSFDYVNRHDDAPDSAAMFASEIILGNTRQNTVRGIDRALLGF